ncbi:hypothetical protein DID75_03085 [Candidatus Marinamargulisbacteria bacterium SCGC AG-410-N11]|nr:hypothetical protein DID75_03085 [Candidatus Marinamargulisbacteria bacterium SCGC AG-410-N11]
MSMHKIVSNSLDSQLLSWNLNSRAIAIFNGLFETLIEDLGRTESVHKLFAFNSKDLNLQSLYKVNGGHVTFESAFHGSRDYFERVYCANYMSEDAQSKLSLLRPEGAIDLTFFNDQDFRSGVVSQKGSKRVNEDNVINKHFSVGDEDVYITGVFDGHGGSSVSTYLARCLDKYIQKSFSNLLAGANVSSFQKLLTNLDQDGASFDVLIVQAIKHAVVRLQAKLFENKYRILGGSTANFCVHLGSRMYVANLGDSSSFYLTGDNQIVRFSELQDWNNSFYLNWAKDTLKVPDLLALGMCNFRSGLHKDRGGSNRLFGYQPAGTVGDFKHGGCFRRIPEVVVLDRNRVDHSKGIQYQGSLIHVTDGFTDFDDNKEVNRILGFMGQYPSYNFATKSTFQQLRQSKSVSPVLDYLFRSNGVGIGNINRVNYQSVKGSSVNLQKLVDGIYFLAKSVMSDDVDDTSIVTFQPLKRPPVVSRKRSSEDMETLASLLDGVVTVKKTSKRRLGDLKLPAKLGVLVGSAKKLEAPSLRIKIPK